MSLPGSAPLGGLVGGPRGQQNQGATPQEQQMIKYMQSAMESCPTKTAMAGVMGAGLGAMFGLFMSSMRYDAPGALNPSAPDVSSLPIRQQLRVGLRDMGRSAYSSGRNFGLVGAIFSGTECCIEGLRAKNELSNGVAAGCITGAVLARNGGPQAVAIGCAGFAAFSAAIDSYMRMPSESDKGGKID